MVCAIALNTSDIYIYMLILFRKFCNYFLTLDKATHCSKKCTKKIIYVLGLLFLSKLHLFDITCLIL